MRRQRPVDSESTPETSSAPDDRGWRRAAARRFLLPFAIATVGIVLSATASGTARIAGWGVLALAITVAISLVFLEIGYGEDRALARERRADVRPRESGRGPRPATTRGIKRIRQDGHGSDGR
jgi:hypothetical protein